jgi:membrane protease YdiL (CAAX protease family)
MTLAPAAAFRVRILGVAYGLGWCLLAYVCLQWAMASILMFYSGSWAINLWLLGATECVVLIGLSGALSRSSRHTPLFADSPPNANVAQRALSARVVLWGVCVGLCLKVPADALRGGIELLYPTPPVELAAQVAFLRHDTWQQILALFVSIGLLGPFAEEVFYRGSAYRLFQRAAGTAFAVAASSVAFALAHAAPRDWLPLLAVALVLGGLRVRAGQLAACVGAHAAFNCAALLLVVTGTEVRVDQGLWLAVAAFSLGATVLLLSQRAGAFFTKAGPQ